MIDSIEINSHTFSIPITGIHHIADGYSFLYDTRENPTIYVPKNIDIVIYLKNNDSDINSMDFNIDDLNVHSKPVTYLQMQPIEFVADQLGTFAHYPNFHPEMNGTMIVYDPSAKWSSQIENPLTKYQP